MDVLISGARPSGCSTGWAFSKNCVRVEFDHAEPRTFDLVVGADGLHSQVRALAFGPEERFADPLGYAFATFEVPNYLNLHDTGFFHLDGDRAVALDLVRERGVVTAFLMFPARGAPRDRDGRLAAVRAAFGEAGWEVPALLAAMPETADFYFDELGLITMPAWS